MLPPTCHLRRPAQPPDGLEYGSLIIKHTHPDPDSLRLVKAAEAKSFLIAEHDRYTVCIAGEQLAIDNNGSYKHKKKILSATAARLRVLCFWRYVPKDYIEDLNVKRLLCMLGQETLLFENETINAIVLFSGPGKSRREAYSKYDYSGRFSDTTFLSNAVVYDSSGSTFYPMAFFFDPSLDANNAKTLVQEFLSNVASVRRTSQSESSVPMPMQRD